MKLSQTAEYALRAAVWLASHPDTALTSAQIAGDTQIPAGYLSKVLSALARSGLVVPRRGPGGGFILARPPEEMTVLEVINAVDPLMPIEQCPLGFTSHGSALCTLHNRLNEALKLVEQVFRNTSIHDLLNTKPDCASLCQGKRIPVLDA